MTAILEASGVSRLYHASPEPDGGTVTRGVEGVDFSLAPGELVVLMGPSGCGKSTLLNLLGLIDAPTAGEIRFEGRPTRDLPDEERSRLRRQRIGHVFQFFHLLPHLTVLENVELPMLLEGLPARQSEPRARALLERFGLGDRGADSPGKLSGGQMQRVSLARALVAGPAVLLADEPTGSLDSAAGAEILELFRTLVRTEGRSIVMATHSAEAAGYGTRVVKMQDGRLV